MTAAKAEGPKLAEAITIRLRKPIQAHGAEIAETSLREPSPLDIATAGYPVVVHAVDGSIGFDGGIVFRLIVRLTNLPQSSVEKMSRVDFLNHFNVVTGFFTEDETDSTDPS